MKEKKVNLETGISSHPTILHRHKKSRLLFLSVDFVSFLNVKRAGRGCRTGYCVGA